jgi:hypothetical protein
MALRDGDSKDLLQTGYQLDGHAEIAMLQTAAALQDLRLGIIFTV